MRAPLPSFLETVDSIDAPAAGTCGRCGQPAVIWPYSGLCIRCESRAAFWRLLWLHRHFHIHPRRLDCGRRQP